MSTSLKRVKHIHLINTHGMGDVVMSLPLMSNLIRAFPMSKLSFTLKGQLEGELVRTLLGQSCGAVLYRSSWKTIVRYFTRLWRLHPEMVIMCAGVEPTTKSAIVALLSLARYRVGVAAGLGRVVYNLSPEANLVAGKHKVIRHLSLLQPLTRIPGTIGVERFRLPPLIRARAAVVLGLARNGGVRYIGISPGSGEAEKHKRWPPKRFGELIRRILDRYPDIRVVLFGNLQEVELCEQVIAHADAKEHTRLIEAAGKYDIAMTAGLVSHMSGFIANCSGLLHLAAYLEVPVLGIYGPTDPKVTGPYTPVNVIVGRNMPCAPCYRKGYERGCGNPICMEELPTDAVFKGFERLLRLHSGSATSDK